MENNIQDDNMEIVPVVDLMTEDGETKTFEILEEIEFEGKIYVALTEYLEELPQANPDDILNVMIMKCYDDENGEPQLENIEDKNIVDKVFDIFVKSQEENTVE